MKNVLVIDDDLYNRENIRLNLIPSENHIDCVDTAKEGLECLSRKNYDLIISEEFLPDQSGINLLKKIQAMGKKNKFILFTNFGINRIKEEAEKLEIDKLVEKPYNESELYRSIKKMLSD